jgi:hypothetical protein
MGCAACGSACTRMHACISSASGTSCVGCYQELAEQARRGTAALSLLLLALLRIFFISAAGPHPRMHAAVAPLLWDVPLLLLLTLWGLRVAVLLRVWLHAPCNMYIVARTILMGDLLCCFWFFCILVFFDIYTLLLLFLVIFFILRAAQPYSRTRTRTSCACACARCCRAPCAAWPARHTCALV